jgi:WD40 repeat protein
MSDVFISYSRLDKTFVRRLHDALAEQKRDVWVDWEDIPATADWWKEICAGIDSTNTFIFIISPDSVRSEVCRNEIDYALKHNKRFIPVLLRDVTEPADEAQVHPAVGSHNWVMLREADDFDAGLATLLKAVDTDLDYVRMHTRLLVRAREWDSHGRDRTSDLLSGDQLREAEGWLAGAMGKQPEPTELHTQFILTSRHQAARRQRQALALAVGVTIFSIVLGIFSLIQAGIARDALRQAEARGTQVAQEVTNVAAAQATAVFNAEIANTQEANAQRNYVTALAAQATAEFNATLAFQEQRRAEDNAAAAAEALGTSEGRGTQIAVQVTEVADARNNAEQNAVAAQNAAATAEFNATLAYQEQIRAEDNAAAAAEALGTSEGRGTQIAVQVTQVAAAQSTSEFNALVAEQNAAAAADALGTSEVRGTQVAVQVTEVADARNIAEQNAVAAQNAAATAEFNATLAYQEQIRAEDNAAAAAEALGTSEGRGTQIAVQVTQVAAAQNTSEFNAEIAEQNAAAAATALNISEGRGTQIAVQVTEVADARNIAEQNAATAEFNATLANLEQQRAEANALAAQNNAATAEFNATLANLEQGRAEANALEAENNAATAIAAQGTAEYNAQQALGQSLAVYAELAIGSGDYDIALALALESIGIRPDLAQAQRVLNRLVYSAARLSFTRPGLAKLSPDGSRLLVAEGEALALYDIASREAVARLIGHSGAVNGANFSHDGRWIISAGADGLVILWDAATGALVRRYSGHDGAVNDVVMTRDNRVILSVGDDTTAITWDATGDGMIRRLVNIASRPIYRAQITPNDADFFIWSGEGESVMGLWRLSDGARRYETQDPIFHEISERSNYALTASTRGSLRVYNAGSSQVVREFTRDFDWSRDVPGARTFNPSGNQVAVSVVNSNTDVPRLLLLDVGNGEQIGRFRGNSTEEERASALAFNADGTLLLSGYGGQIIVWNAETLRPIRRLSAHNETVVEVKFSADGRYAISRSRDGNVRVWDLSLRDVAEERRLVAQTQFPQVNFPGYYQTSTGNVIAAGVYASIFEWDADTGQQINRVDPGGLVLGVAHNLATNRLLVVSEGYTRLLNVPDLTMVTDLFGREGDTYTGEAAFSPDGGLVVFGARSNLYVRGVPGGQRLAVISKADLPSGHRVTRVAITPDNRLLLVAGGATGDPAAPPGEVRAYDVTTGALVLTFAPGHTRAITALAIGPDGRTALTGGEDNDVMMWDIASGTVLRRLVGHTGAVTDIDYTRDGRGALSVSADATMIQWDLATGQPVRTFQGHVEGVTRLTLSQNGRWAVTATGGDTMILWEVNSKEDLVGFACESRYIPTLSCLERAQFGLARCDDAGNPPSEAALCPALTP